MPNLVGMNLDEAQTTLITQGIVNAPSWYQFIPWPIAVAWKVGKPAGQVTAQAPTSGTSVAVNVSVALTVNEFVTGAVYP